MIKEQNLDENPKLNIFLKIYASQIIDTHEKFKSFNRKHQKVDKMVIRTKGLMDILESLLDYEEKISLSKSRPGPHRDLEVEIGQKEIEIGLP